MIGILQNPHLDSSEMKEIVNWHWENISKLLGSFKGKTPNGETIEDLKKEIAPLTFEEIVKAKFDDLQNILDALSNKNLQRFVTDSAAPKHFFIAIYENFRKKFGLEFVEKLELSVCPYCNRNYINNGRRNTTAQFDHFFPKSVYPILALSFYNLIPCCSVCNHIKAEKPIGVSPYDKMTTDKLLRFDVVPKAYGKYTVSLNALQPAMKQNIDVLDLEELYSMHDDLLNELALKTKTYPVVYKDFLMKLFKDKQTFGEMTAREFYYGTYLTEEKYYLRPLSKFVKDVIEQLEKSSH